MIIIMYSCVQICIPIHKDDYWVLFVVRLRESIVEIWDSLLYGNESIAEVLVIDVVITIMSYSFILQVT